MIDKYYAVINNQTKDVLSIYSSSIEAELYSDMMNEKNGEDFCSMGEYKSLRHDNKQMYRIYYLDDIKRIDYIKLLYNVIREEKMIRFNNTIECELYAESIIDAIKLFQEKINVYET